MANMENMKGGEGWKTLELSVGQLNGTATLEKHSAAPFKLLYGSLHLHCWYKPIRMNAFSPKRYIQ